VKRFVESIEQLVRGTPLERPTYWAYSQIRGIGRPRARQSQRYDHNTKRIMAKVLAPASNCVDVGCHKGSVLLSMLAVAPRGTHFAFEPIPALAENLRRRFPGVRVHQVALSDAEGSASFQHVESEPGFSGFRRMGYVPESARVTEIEVRMDTLDRVLPQDTPIAFIKIDVEGAQLQVLKGAAQTIKRNKPYIVFEHGASAEKAYGTRSDQVFDFLTRECGLSISRLQDWLDGKPPLDSATFAGSIGHFTGSEFVFLAHPPRA
jgi:FkbM family methyltransferase